MLGPCSVCNLQFAVLNLQSRTPPHGANARADSRKRYPAGAQRLSADCESAFVRPKTLRLSRLETGAPLS
jgi:hypothetical protein